MSLRNKSALSTGVGLPNPILCYVTDRHLLRAAADSAGIERLLEKMETLAAAGVDWIQIREKDLSGKACAALTRDALHRISPDLALGKSAPRLIINDRLDVALAERAGGVHFGEQSLPVAEAKRLLVRNHLTQTLPRGFLVGASCHSLDAAKAAASDGADYLLFGPVFPTPSKAAYGPAQGIAHLSEVCAAVAIPVLAIGGISVDNAPSCLAAGASGIAAIRLFQNAPDAAGVVRSLRSRMRPETAR